jgi:hypothetical protein
MSHWPIIRLMKDTLLIFWLVAAIVIVYRKLKKRG